MKREFRFSKLYFEFIQTNERLKAKGVTAEDLAVSLQAQGFIKITGPNSYVETEKKADRSNRKELFAAAENTTRCSQSQKPFSFFGRLLG